MSVSAIEEEEGVHPALHEKCKAIGVTVSEPGVVATGSVLVGGYADEKHSFMILCVEATQSLPLPVLISGDIKYFLCKACSSFNGRSLGFSRRRLNRSGSFSAQRRKPFHPLA